MKAEERDGSAVEADDPRITVGYPVNEGRTGYPVNEGRTGTPVLKFETFRSSEAFATWQRGKSIRIVSAVPVMVTTQSETFKYSIGYGHDYGLFVTYEDR